MEPLGRKPVWLRRAIAFTGMYAQIQRCIAVAGVHTVCKEAGCPNRSECFSKGTATFLVMGAICTRHCRFCSVDKGSVLPLDWKEIDRIIETVTAMKLRHTVITSVTRDDLQDGGASFFSALMSAFRERLPDVTVELLIPDLQGNGEALDIIFQSKPDILNHNVETVPSLYAEMRPQADYQRSLEVLQRAKSRGLITKSGLMVGMGETEVEMYQVLDDLYESGCSMVTIGQYLQPSAEQVTVKAYISPEQFKRYREYGLRKGFTKVLSGPFVRSSYHAAELVE